MKNKKIYIVLIALFLLLQIWNQLKLPQFVAVFCIVT